MDKGENQGCLVHYKDLEKAVLDETERCYRNIAAQLKLDNGPVDYARKADELLIKEENLLRQYMHSSSVEQILKTCEKVLFIEYLDWFLKEFKQVLVADRKEDIAAFYKLIKRTPENILGFAVTFEEHYTQLGLAAIER